MTKCLRHTFLISFVGLVLTLIFHFTASATLKFECFSNKEGFNQNTIVSIQQGKYGYLWFGTSNGLIKYDGYNFYDYSIFDTGSLWELFELTG